jgi:hypothetical protein
MQRFYLICGLLFVLIAGEIDSLSAQDRSDPRAAFFRSLAVPGWGHYYADQENWKRGQVHLTAELIMIGSYFGLKVRSNNLEDQYISLTRLKAGVEISDRDRAFRLAIGNFETLEEYNDYQLRTRNWDRLYDDLPENRWNWNSFEDRGRYRDLRSDSESIRSQLPAILGLMVVNRVISGISAYNRVKNKMNLPAVSVTPVLNNNGGTGVLSTILFQF